MRQHRISSVLLSYFVHLVKSNEDLLQRDLQNHNLQNARLLLVFSLSMVQTLDTGLPSCVCYVRLFPLSVLTIRLRKYVRIKARLLGSLWSVHPPFWDNNLRKPGEACAVSERAAELWKGITAPGVFRGNMAMSPWLVSAVTTCQL